MVALFGPREFAAESVVSFLAAYAVIMLAELGVVCALENQHPVFQEAGLNQYRGLVCNPPVLSAVLTLLWLGLGVFSAVLIDIIHNSMTLAICFLLWYAVLSIEGVCYESHYA